MFGGLGVQEFRDLGVWGFKGSGLGFRGSGFRGLGFEFRSGAFRARIR